MMEKKVKMKEKRGRKPFQLFFQAQGCEFPREASSGKDADTGRDDEDAEGAGEVLTLLFLLSLKPPCQPRRRREKTGKSSGMAPPGSIPSLGGPAGPFLSSTNRWDGWRKAKYSLLENEVGGSLSSPKKQICRVQPRFPAQPGCCCFTR